eukprot:9131007-Karenia_brevis.AAC.1
MAACPGVANEQQSLAEPSTETLLAADNASGSEAQKGGQAYPSGEDAMAEIGTIVYDPVTG